MGNYEKMKEAIEKMYEIERSTTAVAKEFKQQFAEKQDNLQRDLTLSPQGRLYKLEEFKEAQGVKFIAKAKQMRKEYDRAATTAQVAAEMFLNEPANKPSDLHVQTFERRLADFETDLMLAVNADQAMQKLRDFSATVDEPYFAREFKQKMPGFVRDISALAAEKAPIYKAQLSGVVDALNQKATSDGGYEAQQVIEGGPRVGHDIWRNNGLQLNAIQQYVGSKFSLFANKPEKFGQEQPEYGGVGAE